MVTVQHLLQPHIKITFKLNFLLKKMLLICCFAVNKKAIF